MKTIWFVRHGESVADRGEATENPQFIFYRRQALRKPEPLRSAFRGNRN